MNYSVYRTELANLRIFLASMAEIGNYGSNVLNSECLLTLWSIGVDHASL